MRNIGLFLLIAILTSCQPILKLALGIKKPKYESFESIQAFCVANQLSTANLFVPKQSWFEKRNELKYVQKDTLKPRFGIPAVLAFDKNGAPLTLNNPGDCTPGALTALSKLTPEDSLASLTAPPYADLQTFLSYFEGANHNPVSFEDIADSSDVYIGFFWPKYWPKATLEYYQDLQKVINANNGVKYKLIMFNGDYQQGGGDEKIRFTKK